MFGRSRQDRDVLTKMVAEFGSHTKTCADDKAEIKRRLDEQDAKSNERHEDNVKRLDAIQTQNQKTQTRVLLWALATLTGILGSILASSVHFKIALGP